MPMSTALQPNLPQPKPQTLSRNLPRALNPKTPQTLNRVGRPPEPTRARTPAVPWVAAGFHRGQLGPRS